MPVSQLESYCILMFESCISNAVVNIAKVVNKSNAWTATAKLQSRSSLKHNLLNALLNEHHDLLTTANN